MAATVDGKKRRIFAGNLIEPVQSRTGVVRARAGQPCHQGERAATARNAPAYPERALVELLVNMIVHRDFAIAKPSQINVVLNHSVRFMNPAAPLPAAAGRLTLRPDGAFEPVPQFSDLRNRACATCFLASAQWSAQARA